MAGSVVCGWAKNENWTGFGIRMQTMHYCWVNDCEENMANLIDQFFNFKSIL